MRILITGGSGFIGSYLSKNLLELGHEVIILDNLSTGVFSNISEIIDSESLTFINTSILDVQRLDPLVESCDYVFHLAAAVGVMNIMDNPLQSLLTNIRGTENVLEACSKYSKPVLITSSSEVYGKNNSDSLREGDDRVLGSPIKLRWSYSEAKAIDESLAYAYHVEKKLEVRIVRFFNTVGPRQLGSYGMVLPRFVKSAINDDLITIYGDGKQTRCFAHVLDVIDALLAIAFETNTIGKVINIGNNSEISMNDLAKKIVEMTGSKSKIVHIPYEEAYGIGFEDMERRVPNLELIQLLVGWKPKRDLSSIITDIVNEMNNAH